MKKIIIVIAVLIIIILIAATLLYYRNIYSEEKHNPEKDVETTISEELNREAIEVVATNLEVPWSIEFLPEGDLLVTERPGNLVRISNGERILIANIDDVKNFGEGGLMGLVLHPDFESNNLIYLMYTYDNEGDNTKNRVVRYKYENDTLSEREIIVDEIPGARFHNGGRIKFGPDKFLYITTGDSQEPSLSQNRDSLAGKILRVTEDGSPAPDNPFDTLVYSYGHRNPQGITWDENGNLWQTEHGRSLPTGFDEINQIKPGLNYGWPEIEGDETRSGMESPVADSGLETWAPGSAAIVRNSLFFGGLRPEALFEYKIYENNQVLVKHFSNEFGRIREATLGPNGYLYITTSNRDGRGEPVAEDDRIIKIDPAQL